MLAIRFAPFLLNKNFTADVVRRPRRKMQRPLLKRNNRVASSEQLSNVKQHAAHLWVLYIGDEIVQLGMFFVWVFMGNSSLYRVYWG